MNVRKTWRINLNETIRTIILDHDDFTGKHMIRVDGAVQLHEWDGDAKGRTCRFLLETHALSLQIIQYGPSYRYDCYLDQKIIDPVGDAKSLLRGAQRPDQDVSILLRPSLGIGADIPDELLRASEPEEQEQSGGQGI